MSEQAKVGALVVVTATLLLVTLFTMTELGVRGRYKDYKMYLQYAGGLEPGAPVRYGGLKVGRVEELKVSAADPSKIEIALQVNRDTRVPSDSVAGLSQLGFLGENYIEIQPGKSRQDLAPGSTLPSLEAQDMGALMRRMNGLMEQAQPMLADLHKNLNTISAQVEVVLKNVDAVTGPANQQRLNSILTNTDQMIARSSPKVDEVMGNFQTASRRLDPLIADLQETTKKVDRLMVEVNGMVDENRKDIQSAVQNLSKTLETTRLLMTQLNAAMVSNTGNLEAILANVEDTTANLRDLSDTLRQRPFSLIRVIPRPDRQVPGAASNGKARTGGGSN